MFTKKTKMLLLLIAMLSAIAFTACGGGSGGGSGGDSGGGEQIPPPTFTVDSSVQPLEPTISGVDGGTARPVGSVVDRSGHRADFVLNELVVSTNDTGELEAMLARWNGRIIKTISYADTRFSAIPSMHLIYVDVVSADTSRLAADIRQLVPYASGDHRFSNEDGIRLAAVGAHEAAQQGITVSMNWLLEPMSIANGSMAEAPKVRAGDRGESMNYSVNPRDWPYMNRNSPQDIGVVAAWQALLATNRLSNRVNIMVIDGGFDRDNQDLPPDAVVFGGWNVPNPTSCGGFDCFWHGTHVAETALGLPDNGYGVAGPAGPVGRLIAVTTPRDLWGMFAYIPNLINGLAEGPDIINISSSGEISAVLALFADPLFSSITEALNAAGTLIVASAGNAKNSRGGVNVDREDCLLFGLICWEESLLAPCELTSVVCVGGMDWNTTARAWNSNWGNKTEDTSVDIYGPFTVWLGPEPNEANEARIGSGTSYSAPFVAGVAALVKAANPDLSPNEIWDILRDSAHVGGLWDSGPGNQRRINAYGAVARALGNQIPPYVNILRPNGFTSHSWRTLVTFLSEVMQSPISTATPVVTWYSDIDGVIGTGPRITTNSLSVGRHTITVEAVQDGLMTADSVSVSILNNAPIVTYISPQDGGHFCVNELITFSALVVDPNNDSPPPVLWQYRLASAGDEVTPTDMGYGATIQYAFNVAGAYEVVPKATDELSLTGSGIVRTFYIESCINLPPTVTIIQPISDIEVYANGVDGFGNPYYEITLQANASDPDGLAIFPKDIKWYTDRGDLQPGGTDSGQQSLGWGFISTERLYVGRGGRDTHIVTVTATDEGGASRSASRAITVNVNIF